MPVWYTGVFGDDSVSPGVLKEIREYTQNKTGWHQSQPVSGRGRQKARYGSEVQQQ